MFLKCDFKFFRKKISLHLKQHEMEIAAVLSAWSLKLFLCFQKVGTEVQGLVKIETKRFRDFSVLSNL